MAYEAGLGNLGVIIGVSVKISYVLNFLCWYVLPSTSGLLTLGLEPEYEWKLLSE